MSVNKFGGTREVEYATAPVIREGASLLYIHDNFLRNDGTNLMYGVLNMGNNKISNVADPQDSQDVVTSGHLERVSDILALNAGTDLDMGRHKIRNLPLQPSDADPSDAVSKYYVDHGRTKPVITVWATERGRLNAGTMEWSFGHGSSTRHTGYTMLTNGRVLCMGIASNHSGGNQENVTVKLTVNGDPIDECTVTQTAGNSSGVTTFHNDLQEVRQADILNFITVTENENALASVVTLLIELDL